MPGAKLALALSERVAAGAETLADLAAGTTARQAAQAASKRLRRAKAEASDVAIKVPTLAAPNAPAAAAPLPRRRRAAG